MKFHRIILLLLAPPLCGADWYIRDGASGTGVDWANACDDLAGSCAIANIARGDTVYVAGGTYASVTANKATSSTLAMTIKGATIASHGTATGWSDAYSVCSTEGGARADWGVWTVSTSYWTIDGSCGGGSADNGTTTGYGFRSRSDSNGLGAVGFLFTVSVVGINLSHYEIDGIDCCTMASGDNGKDGLLCSGGCDVDGTFSRLYIHDVGRTFFLMGGDSTLEYSFMARNRSTDEQHGEAWAHRGGTLIARYNIFEDVRGTGHLVQLIGTGVNWEVYGNVFRVVSGACPGCNPGAYPTADNTGSGTINGLKFYNNTIYGLVGVAGVGNTNGSSGYDIRNNFWYQNNYGIGESGTFTYNAMWDTYIFFGPSSNGPYATGNHYICGDDGGVTGTNCQDVLGTQVMPPSAAATFVSAPTNLRLNAASISGNYCSSPCALAGTALSSPYNADMDGNVRGADGAWDRGAYEYSAGGGGGSTTSSRAGGTARRGGTGR